MNLECKLCSEVCLIENPILLKKLLDLMEYFKKVHEIKCGDSECIIVSTK